MRLGATVAGRGARIAAVAAVLLAALCIAAGPGGAQQPAPCTGSLTAGQVAERPGPPLRFGITPGVQTGQLATGAAPPRTPEDPAGQSAALARLVPAGVPFVLRLHRFFWSDGEAGVQHFLELANRYTSSGLLVELQLRYHPSAAQQGDIAGWTAFVREVVDRFGPNRRVVGIQVTNEVNLPISPDSSDGYYSGGREALVQGVIAAKEEARRRGFDNLRIGFNWAYRSDPQDDADFWAYIRDTGGRRFLDSLDWVGLDAYPGSFFPPVEPPGGERDGMVNAMSALRCYAGGAGIPASVPLQVEENGFPTAPTPDRSYARQAQALETMVRAVSDFRGTFNVSDYRWFDLRDSDSTSPNFQQQYGLMTDTYGEKPAFAVYRALIATLSARTPAATGKPAKHPVALRLRSGCTRAGALSIVLAGTDSRAVRGVRITVGGRLVAHRRRAPVRLRLGGRRTRRGTVRARVVLDGGRTVLLEAPARSCRRAAAHFAA